MKKSLFLILPLLFAACINRPDSDEKTEYKCGEQVVQTEILGSDSMLVKINGINNLLIRTLSAGGRSYENNATRVVFTQKNGETYLSIGGRSYPVCQELAG